ncbi:hypothetical protein [Streptomyces bambusae]|uniref:Secreted protein n=1 Tax=Streptomyces bambusae TaxID=1550616 RepID=A0ABS6YZL3_9ACTN|nr:hypothetical protein [Streptomyces bambusae]MBW5480913.1 hypothetical protein [Streptomyces bambusae]
MKITTARRLLAAAALALATAAGATTPGQAVPAAPAQPAAGTAAASLPGYQVFNGGPATTDNFARMYMACPEGKVVVGGGGEAQGPDGLLLGSFPSYDGGTYRWNVVARQDGQSQVTTTGHIICVDSAALPGYQIVSQPSANVSNGGSREVSCPSGKVVVGGGAEALGPSATLRYSVPIPAGRVPYYMWTASGRSLSESSVGLAVTAICADPVPGYEIITAPSAETPNPNRLTVTCPQGKAILSGGPGGYNSAVVSASRPEFISSDAGYRWMTSVREPSRSTAISSASAICASV